MWNEFGGPADLLTAGDLSHRRFITTGFMYFIVPAYIKIFEDFDADLPEITQLLIRISVFIGDDFFPLLFLGLMALAVFCRRVLFAGARESVRLRSVAALHLPPLMRVERGRTRAAVADGFGGLGEELSVAGRAARWCSG